MPQARRWWSIALPVVVAVGALALAVLGGILTDRGGGIGPLNLFVESLSGTSGRLLGDGWALLPLGFAFGAGIVSAVNPCGFVMLPAYLALYIKDSTRLEPTPLRRLSRALLVGATVSVAFMVLTGSRLPSSFALHWIHGLVLYETASELVRGGTDDTNPL